MKKKTMMVAVLVGALSLGACVDNNESASVEAVRGAKAEQLKSLATLNNANAEAALILAKAEAAIKEATAEGMKIANELKGIELEIAKAGLSGKLEAAKVAAEAELLDAKVALENAKAALIAAMDQVTIAEKKRVQDLLREADAVLGRIDSNRTDLITAKFNKAGLEAGLVDVKDLQAQTIAGEKRNIAISEALIAEYSKYSQTSYDEALKAANEAEAKAAGLAEVETAAANVLTSATAKVQLAKGNVLFSVYLANATTTKPESVAPSTIEYTYSDGTYGIQNVQGYSKMTADMVQMNADVTKATRDLVNPKLDLKDAEKALADKMKSADYTAAVKAVTDAQKAYDEATTTTDKDIARVALESAENALKNFAQAEKDDVKDATDLVEQLTVVLKTATDKLAAVTANEAAYAALLTVWEDAMKAETEATIAADKANHDTRVQTTLAQQLRRVAGATSDIAGLIQGEKTKIATANQNIAEAASVANAEEAIAKEDRNIAKLEQELKIDEAAYADYMAQVKALIEAAK